VGAFVAGVRADMDATEAEGAPPPVPPPVMRVDTRREDWAPAISFVVDEACTQFLGFAVGSDELAGFAPRVWIAGEIGTPVTLRWDVWDAQDGWRTGPEGGAAAVTSTLIDPDAAGEAVTVAAPLPFDDRAGQAVLYAIRTYRRALDGATLTVRSNPLLVNLHEESP
jgi:hypothetical protein